MKSSGKFKHNLEERGGFNSTFNKFIVTYDAISREVKCQCLLFESRGILYRHSLSVLNFERVDKVAPKYILERWSKNIKRRHTHIKSSQDEPLLELRNATLSAFNDLQSPPRVRTRGRPKNRLESNMLNLLDDGSMIQSSSNLYKAQDINYLGEDFRNRNIRCFNALFVHQSFFYSWPRLRKLSDLEPLGFIKLMN
ncbi:hypothetical protein Ahy_A03g010185 [Arachis hypogaea]|uniref:Protein FAR1-RELATED SEQUENCE n=1 Tax=Arachis hypogaea TaxID=3818 RepID=A0A445DLC8_ARAHY|nr:hypothetical protein Ahy_A03g010185 [Arachis hypogaea]